MAGHRFSAGWMLALGAAAAFVVGASAQEGVRAIRAVVTPDNPLWGQDPQTRPRPQEENRAGRTGRRQALAPRPVRSGHHRRGEDRRRHLQGPSDQRQLFYEIPKAELDKDFLWVTQIKRTTIGAGYGGQAVGNRVVRWVLKGDRVLLENIDYSIVADPCDADRRGRGRREPPGDHPRVQRRGVQCRGRSGHRRHAAVHHRRAGVLGARRASAAAGSTRPARSSRRWCRSRRTSTSR